MIDWCDVRSETEVLVLLGCVWCEGRGRETTKLGDGMQDQGMTAGFPSAHEEEGTILIFVLRQIGSSGDQDAGH